jgi:transcriptional regulator with XRE-family HTH domain
MGVQFIGKIRERLGGITYYELAKRLGIPPAIIGHYEKKGQAIKPAMLCELRKISGMNWKEFGQILDDEFLTDKTK